MKLVIPNRSSRFLVLADQAVVSGTSFLSNLVIARSLGISDYGAFSAVILLQVFLLSIQQSVASGIYQVLYSRFRENRRQAYTNGLFYLQLSFLLLLLLIGISLYCTGVSMGSLNQHLFIPAAVMTLLFLFQDFLRKVLITSRQEAKALIIDCITNGLQLILLFLLAFKKQMNLPLALWISGITFIPSVIMGIVWVAPGRFSAIHWLYATRQHRKQGGWMFLSALLQWFAGNFFVVAAGWWLGLAALGALRLGQFIFGLLNVLLQAIENYALPRASGLHEDAAGFNRFLRTLLKTTAWVFIPLLLLLVIFARPLLQLAGGAAYQQYSYVMYALAIVYVLIISGLPVRIALRVTLLNKNYFIGYVLATVISLLTARWLIAQWQLAGVLTGLFFTQLTVLIYWLYILKQKNILSWKSSTSF